MAVNATLKRGLQFLCFLPPVTVAEAGWRCKQLSTSTVHRTKLPHRVNPEPTCCPKGGIVDPVCDTPTDTQSRGIVCEVCLCRYGCWVVIPQS